MKTFGLQNVGSICYFNSLIQSLISCESFTSALLSCEKDEDDEKALLIDTFKNFLTDASGSGISKLVINAYPVLREIKKLYSTFGNGQEDAMEGFDTIISLIDDKAIYGLFESSWHMDVFCGACKKVVSTGEEKMIRVIMGEDYIPFARTRSIEAFVSGHMSKFTDYNCSTCKAKRVEGINVYRLTVPPPILVVSFNKYNGKWLADPVSRIMSVKYGIGNDSGIAKYKLVAIIHHSGGKSSGHYTATAVRGDKIYLFNDSRVVEREEFEDSKNDYILVYVKG